MRFFVSLKKLTTNQLIISFLVLLISFLLIWFVGLRIGKPVLRSVCVAALSNDSQVGLPDQKPRVIEAQTVSLGTMSKRINTVGHLRAKEAVVIKAELAARIAEILFTEGGMVKKGDLIIRFEDEDLKAALQQAEGEYEVAKADFERVNNLFNKNIESTKKLDESKGRLKIAEGKVTGAKANLAKANIKAPFDGIIGIINVSPGSFVQGATELVTVVDNTSVKAIFKIPEKNIHDVGVGQVAEIKVGAFKKQIFTGTVEAVDAKIDTESHSLQVKASIPNPDGLLREGLFADVSLIVGEKGNTMSVDESAVDRLGEREFVWVVTKGRADRRPVLTGTRENGKVEIVAGLQPNEIVVISGQLKLSDGAKVKISNMPDPSIQPML
jgi:membrane fusion protein (multidrug efflux system)